MSTPAKLLVVLIALGLLSGAGKVWTSAPKVNEQIIVSIVDTSADFYIDLDRDKFEDMLQSAGPDCVITINAPRVTGRLVKRMAETIGRCTTSPPIRPDFRYRIAVAEAGRTVTLYYFTKFGEIYDGTGRCGVAQDQTVYEEIWREIDAKARIGRLSLK